MKKIIESLKSGMKKLLTKILTLIIGLTFAALVYFSLWGLLNIFIYHC